jgi:hypothetical protein
MDAETRRAHLAAGQRAGRESTCGEKVDYKSEETADLIAAKLNARAERRNTLEGYPCYWCSGWHIGRKMSAAELRG